MTRFLILTLALPTLGSPVQGGGEPYRLSGEPIQGGMMIGRTQPGSRVLQDGEEVRVSREGGPAGIHP